MGWEKYLTLLSVYLRITDMKCTNVHFDAILEYYILCYSGWLLLYNVHTARVDFINLRQCKDGFLPSDLYSQYVTSNSCLTDKQALAGTVRDILVLHKCKV